MIRSSTEIVRKGLASWPRAAFIAITWAAWLTPALSAEWRISPRVQTRATYTDNVRLAPRGQEQSDFVTEVEPGVSISGRGARLQLQADYAFKYRFYANNSDANGHDHALRANGLMDVWDRKLFLQGSANIADQDISTLGALPSSDVNITANRTEVRQATLSPYWISRLGNFANAQARYTWNRAESDGETSVLDTESQTISLGLSSGAQFSNLGWSLAYSKQEIESSQGQFDRRELESITASSSYRLLPTLSALATIGRDENTYGAGIRGSTGGNFHSVGLEWAPSSRTRVRGEFGERYFGNTVAFNAEHRTRRTTWSLIYSEQIVATPGLFSLPVNIDTSAQLDRLFLSQFPDPIERQQVIQAFIFQSGLPNTLSTSVDFLTNQVSLSKRLQGTAGLRGTRSTVLVSVFRDNRSNESAGETLVGTDPFSISDEVIQTGYSAILSWRFAEQTTGSVSLGQIRSEFTDAGREDTNSNFRIGLAHRLQPKLHGAIEYRFTNRDSNAAGADVRENAVTGTLTLLF